MIISDFIFREGNGTIRSEANIKWEESDRKPFNLFVQTSEEFREFSWPDPNSFLIATVLTAWNDGEKRILVKGRLCPVLVNNLQGVFMMMKSWYPADFGPVPTIETTEGFNSHKPSGRGAISLMSGGIDSLCLLRSNHLYFHKDHPAYIKAVLPIAMGKEPAQSKYEFSKHFEGRLTSVNVAAEDQGVDVVPAYTNIYWLNPDGYFYGQKSYGAQLSAMLSFFSKKFNHGLIASSYDAAYSNKPWGSNPQLDAYYSSSLLRIENSGSEMTRLKKVGIVADWPVGYDNMRVCQNDNSGSSNCGTCEKCIRTKLMLESHGKLKDCKAFPDNYIDTKLLSYLETYNMLSSTDKLHNEEKVYQYGLTIPYLKQRGRTDLSDYLETILKNLK